MNKTTINVWSGCHSIVRYEQMYHCVGEWDQLTVGTSSPKITVVGLVVEVEATSFLEEIKAFAIFIIICSLFFSREKVAAWYRVSRYRRQSLSHFFPHLF